jgi:hypothetical protein
VALLLLGTGFLVALAALLLVSALWSGNRKLAARAFTGGALMGGGYLILLLAFSFASEERVLGAGEWKYFCELDCHTAYTVTDVRQAKTLGSGEHTATAEGMFYVVTLKTWFDPNTMRADRGNGLLFPNARRIQAMDEQGRRLGPSLEGMKALESGAAKLIPLTQPLRPGESYETTFVFDVPDDFRNPRLLLTDPDPMLLIVIGHENSFFHKKVYFRMDGQAPASALDISRP